MASPIIPYGKSIAPLGSPQPRSGLPGFSINGLANNAVVSKLGYAGAARAARTRYPGLTTQRLTSFPYPSVKAYLDSMRLRWRLRNVKTQQQAVAEARAFIATQGAAVNQQVDAIHAANQFDAKFMNAAEIGVVLIAAGAGIGACAGPIGAVVGGVIGAVVAVILALIPFDKLDFLGRFQSTIDKLAPIERLLLVARFRECADHARDQEKQPRYPVWREGTATGGFLEHTIYEGVDALALFCFQNLLDSDWCPAPDGDAESLIPYCAAVIASLAPDDRPLRDSIAWQHMHDGKGPRWLWDVVRPMEGRNCGEIRAAIIPTVPEMDRLIITDHIGSLILARDNELAAQKDGAK